MTDKALFELLAGRTLALAEANFPKTISIKPLKLLELEEVQPTPHNLEVGHQTIRWLRDEGYLRCSGPHHVTINNQSMIAFNDVVLTSKGLAALNAGTKGRVGEILEKELNETGKDARSAIVSEIVGQIFGVAIKALPSWFA